LAAAPVPSGVDEERRQCGPCKYAPILSRVRSVPRQGCHHFDVCFSKFDTDERGAIRISFAREPQTPPATIAAIAPTTMGLSPALDEG
jgi:hypothetical protein